MSYIYLASPYTDPDKGVMQSRAEAAEKAYVHLLKEGKIVYSPIAANHHIALKYDLPKDWGFWGKFDRSFIASASELYVLLLPGWTHSKGVLEEINIARRDGIVAYGLRPLTYDLVRLHEGH